MKIVLAPNALKGSMSAADAARAMARGVRRIDPAIEIAAVPVADGGDGLLEVLGATLKGTMRRATVSGPLGEAVEAEYTVFDNGAAAVEMARASGLVLVPPERRSAARTTSRGTGELIRAALDDGSRRVYVGIGGSATNDGATGIATALGARFLDAHGGELAPVGASLGAVRRIDLSGLHPAVARTRFDVVCDVDSPLLGARGAARVYAPQKGASPDDVERLEAGMGNLADVIERDLGIDVRQLAGGGAAGGAGAGLVAFLGAQLHAGIELVLELVGFDETLSGADLVLTAEGQLDGQTANAKAPAGVARRARARGIPCIAFAGGLADGLAPLRGAGIDAWFSICPRPVSLRDAMRDAGDFLADAVEQAVRAFVAGRGSKGA